MDGWTTSASKAHGITCIKQIMKHKPKSTKDNKKTIPMCQDLKYIYICIYDEHSSMPKSSRYEDQKRHITTTNCPKQNSTFWALPSLSIVIHKVPSHNQPSVFILIYIERERERGLRVATMNKRIKEKIFWYHYDKKFLITDNMYTVESKLRLVGCTQGLTLNSSDCFVISRNIKGFVVNYEKLCRDLVTHTLMQ